MKFEKELTKEQYVRALRVHQVYYEDILTGKKTAELRPARSSYQSMAPGDHVQFECNQDGRKIEVEITDVRLYKSLDEVGDNEDISKIAPGMDHQSALRKARQLFRRAPEKTFMIIEFKLMEG
jgi:ASC-1-like (ASCH) protein